MAFGVSCTSSAAHQAETCGTCHGLQAAVSECQKLLLPQLRCLPVLVVCQERVRDDEGRRVVVVRNEFIRVGREAPENCVNRECFSGERRAASLGTLR